MLRSTTLLSIVARACSRPAFLVPVSRWALGRLRKAAATPSRSRARTRPTARRARPVAEVQRAGPSAAPPGPRRATRLTWRLLPRWW